MKKGLPALVLGALAVAGAQPAAATTFPALTTIYVGSGVRDSAAGPNAGSATIVNCSNVSGQTASIRMLFLHADGAIAGLHTFNSVAHGSTVTLATHSVSTYVATSLNVLQIAQGAVNIESTQSGVFCNAIVIEASQQAFTAPIPLVRVNPHPGTVE